MLVYILVGVVIDVFGGFHMKFAVTTNGIRSATGKGSRAAGTVFWAGLLTGKAGMTGVGLLARSEQDFFIPYCEVERVSLPINSQSIKVRGNILQKPIGLYCLESNY